MARFVPYKERTVEEIQQLLEKEFEHWENLHAHGGNDPFWSDGVNLNLVRNHIIYYYEIIDEMESPKEGYQMSLFDSSLPVRRELPPELPHDFMAQPDEIRINAIAVREWLRTSEDYAALCDLCDQVEPRIFKKECLAIYTQHLHIVESCLETGNLVDARRVGNLEFTKSMINNGLARLHKILGDEYTKPPESDFDDEDILFA